MFWAPYWKSDLSPGQAGRAPVRRRIGVVLGAGAARGWAHIGALQELDAQGIRPDVIVGSSIGSLVGGCYAAGKLEMLEAFARSLTRRRMFGLIDFSFAGGGLIGGERLRARLESELGGVLIEDLPVRFAGVATEIGGGHEIWLRRGLLDRRDPRLLRVARRVRARTDRGPLAVRRRDRQSGSGQRRQGARRGTRHCAQYLERERRPRHRHSGSVRTPRSAAGRRRADERRAGGSSHDGGGAGPRALRPTPRPRRPA